MDRYHVNLRGEDVPVELTDEGDRVRAKVGDREYLLEAREVGRDALSLRVEHRSYFASVAADGEAVRVKLRGERYLMPVLSDRDWHFRNMAGGPGADGGGAGSLKAPMPGKVLELKVAVGDAVEAGAPLLILEAMKMENELRAAGPGTVAEILVGPGDAVEGDVELIRFETEE